MDVLIYHLHCMVYYISTNKKYLLAVQWKKAQTNQKPETPDQNTPKKANMTIT